MIAQIVIAGIADTAIDIAAVGFALLAILRRRGWLVTETPASHVLCAIALALYWSTLAAIAVVVARVGFTDWVAHAKHAIDAAIIAAGLVYARREMGAIAVSIRRDGKGLLALMAAGAVFGLWACLQFPHVLDSTQIIWTQDALVRAEPPPPSPMIGFSGIVIFLGRYLDGWPIATVSAGFKPLLAMIAAAAAWHAADCLGTARRGVSALLLFALMLLSSFGLYGLAELGKASIYGVLFGAVFMAALAGPRPARRAPELALFFAVAAATGGIAVPYIVVAYLIWLPIASPAQKAWSTARAIYVVGLPILPALAAGFFGTSLIVLYGGYLFAGAAIVGIRRLVPRPGPVLSAAARLPRRVRAWIPPVALLPCLFLFPVAAHVIGWVDRNGHGGSGGLPPLDGRTTFLGFLFKSWPVPYSWPTQAVTIGLGLAAVGIGFTPLGRRRPGLVAVAAMPFVVLLLSLLRLHLGLPVFTPRQMWDLVKDIPQWCGGPVFGFLAVAMLAALLPAAAARRRWSMRRAAAGGAAAIGIAVAAAAGALVVRQAAKPVFYTSSGGHSDADAARLADVVWRNFRGETVYVDADWRRVRPMSLDVAVMYGMRVATLTRTKLMQDEPAAAGAAGFIVRHDLTPTILAFASRHRASVTKLAAIESGGVDVLAVSFDGRGRVRVPGSGAIATLVDGAHNAERHRGVRHQWIGSARAVIAASGLTADRACLAFALFSARGSPAHEIVSVEAPGRSPVAIDIAGTSIDNRRRVMIPIVVRGGGVRVSLRTTEPPIRFPNDYRAIFYGVGLPIELRPAADCGGAAKHD